MPANGPHRFSESPLWDLQKSYYERIGPEAWSEGIVPHYITNNPFIAEEYVRLILAYFRDLYRQGHGDLKVHILELGAGAGKLGYLILKTLHKWAEDVPHPVPDYTYLLSDLAASNLEFWQQHPRLVPFIQTGKLDLVQLDAYFPDQASLHHTGQNLIDTLAEGPVILLGNYFFDSIPQDLFRIGPDGFQEAWVALTEGENGLFETSPAELLEEREWTYVYREAEESPYADPELDGILATYAEKLTETHLLFPHVAIRLLQQLLGTHPHGALVLVSDKGDHDLPGLDGQEAPFLNRHGSISVEVNFHALHRFCENRGGKGLLPKGLHFSIWLNGLLFPPGPHRETEFAFRHGADAFSSDDFHGIKAVVHAQGQKGELDLRQLVPAMRLSRHDPKLFLQLLPQVEQVVEEWRRENEGDYDVEMEREELRNMLMEVWDNYYPLELPLQNDPLRSAIQKLLRILGYGPEG